ncbi:hypothetical protein GCM10022221_30800 [Actinocorallia aurea]
MNVSRNADGHPTGHLHHEGSVFINFKNGTYQWVDIQRFRLAAAVTDQQALAMLIGHDMYGRDYAGGEAGADPARHGPYWRDRITPEAFEPTEAAAELHRLKEWAEQYAGLPEQIRADLDRELYTPLSEGRLYRLRDLGTAAFHDWGGVHNEFHELVLINPENRRLTLMVAADD